MVQGTDGDPDASRASRRVIDDAAAAAGAASGATAAAAAAAAMAAVPPPPGMPPPAIDPATQAAMTAMMETMRQQMTEERTNAQVQMQMMQTEMQNQQNAILRLHTSLTTAQDTIRNMPTAGGTDPASVNAAAAAAVNVATQYLIDNPPRGGGGNNPRAPDLHREWDSSVKRAGKPPVFSGHEPDWHTYASSFNTWAQTAGVEHVFNQAYTFPQAGNNWRGTRATDEVVRLEVEKVKFCYNTLNQSMKGRLRRDKGR